MKQFALLDATPALLVNVNPRSEKHGKTKVPAVDLRIEVTAPNTLLDQLKPHLRQGLYVAANDTQEQPDLEGVEAVSDTPMLRVEGLQPTRLDDELTGYTVTFDIGTGRKDSVVVLEGCKLKGFQVDALQGGSVKILYTVQAANVSERAFGKLCTLIDCEVSLMMVPPDEEQPSLPIATVGGEAAAIVTH